jgi:hypothetical protein
MNGHLESPKVKALDTVQNNRVDVGNWLAELTESISSSNPPADTLWILGLVIPTGEASHRKKVADWIKSIQYKGLKVVAGAYKATSAAELEIEYHTKPIPQQLNIYL